MRRIMLAVVASLVGTAAIAQTEWYVVQDTTTKRCEVVYERPTTTRMVVVTPNGGTVYKSRAQAEAGMRANKGCETRETR